MSSMAKTAAEAKALVGKDLDLSGGILFYFNFILLLYNY